jgi:hypothetical protein
MQAVPACTGPSSSDLSFGALSLGCRQLSCHAGSSALPSRLYFDGLPYKAASSALCEMLPRRMAGVICRLLLCLPLLFRLLFENTCPHWCHGSLVVCLVLSRDQGAPLMLSRLPTAVCTSGPVPGGVVPVKFVVFVFHATRTRRLPDWQCLPPLVFGVFGFISCSFLSLSLLKCVPLLVPVNRWPVVWCLVLSRDQGAPLMLSRLPTAVCTSGPVPNAVVPVKFVVSVFQATMSCRLPHWRCLPPLVFGFFCFISCSFLLLSQVCASARACRSVACGLVFVAFTRPGLSRCTLWAACRCLHFWPCAKGSRASQVCCLCVSRDQAASPA